MIDNVILVVYLLVVLAAGLWCGRNLKSVRDFSLSDIRYGSLVIFATLSASFIGGGFCTGNASKVFLFGIGNIVALWGFSIKEVLVARFIVPHVKNFPEAISAGDIMGQTYGRFAQIVTGVFSMLLCAGILGAQVSAMGYVFEVFTGYPAIWGILLGLGAVVLYSTAGGMRAVVLTDVIQFAILAVGLPLALVFGIAKVGGIGALVEAVPADRWQLVPEGSTWVAFVSLFLTLMLGETLVPPYVQRLLMGKTARKTARGTLWAGLFSFPFFAITGLFGLVALAMSPELQSDHAMAHVIREALPVGLRGLVIAGVVAVVMSSADSFLNGAATALVQDVVRPLRGRSLTNTGSLRLARVANLLTGVGAVATAMMIPNVLDILIFAYYFWAPVILCPLALALLGVRTTFAGFLAGCLAGIAGVCIWKYVCGDPFGFDGLVFGIFTNLAALLITNAIVQRGEASKA